MNDHEAQRIAAAAHELRPDWPASSVLTLIRKNLIAKPRRDVSVAFAWIACESNTATPARILETGPWWRAAGTDGATTKRDQPTIDERCSICSEAHKRCREVWSYDHEFESAAVAAKRKAEGDPEALTKAIAALKAEVAEAPDREPPTGRGLESLADRDPKLRARVDALRAALPANPPMREPEPPTTHSPDPQPEAAT